jgi:hypothetical protein
VVPQGFDGGCCGPGNGFGVGERVAATGSFAFCIEASLLAPQPLLAVALAAARLSASPPAAAALAAAIAAASASRASASSSEVGDDGGGDYHAAGVVVSVQLPAAFLEPALVSLQLSAAHCETALLELLPVATELQRFVHRCAKDNGALGG